MCENVTKITDIFGSLVFNDSVMRAKLPKNTYKALKKTISDGLPLDADVADVVATAMKDWAMEKGVTHYTHWFQPLTGLTAEKHDAFVSPSPSEDGKAIMEFSGKELIKGEPDASSFPSGGLRATFEARGYTVWDCSSPAFIKDGTLCIPTAFFSYTGEALDKKTPLLRSGEALEKQVLRILKLFGEENPGRIFSTEGPEQEYFLIDSSMFKKRKDLLLTGRTLFGAKPPKGQELEDHYFGNIKERIIAFMAEYDAELYKLGIFSKTRHNEVAPAQHEMAPIFGETNVATDHNQLVMEMLKKVANRHGLACLLHEKPFAGINGSGKHNNWSINSSKGDNYLNPGKTPHQNARFLLFLAAILKAIDENAGLLRASAASAANDHRLGANEAPPAVISIFLGDELAAIVDQIEKGDATSSQAQSKIDIGVTTLPNIPKDSTDRNRTSPFAFTTNKFEFRMVGSSASIAGPNTVLNTIVAEALAQFADELEKASDFGSALNDLIKKSVVKHKRIIFNGNGYDDAWLEEAAKRGLPNLKTSVDAIPEFISPNSIAMFEKHGVYTSGELHSRYEIKLEKYVKVVTIEALTALDMAKQEILPAIIKFTNVLADTVIKLQTVKADSSVQEELLTKVSSLLADLSKGIALLEANLTKAEASHEVYAHAVAIRDLVLPAMADIRTASDALEAIVDKAYWPIPTYSDILFNV